MRVQKLRLQRGWSQEQLAVISGLSVRTIQRIERGQPASAETLKALGAVFEIDFSELKEPEMETAPSNIASPDEALAFEHVRRLKAFYLHVAQYVLTIGFLAVVNFVITPRYLWVIWPALGWGLGLALHGLKVFDKIPFFGADWEKSAVERRLGRRL